MKRIEQKEKRRQEILAVGLDLFIRKGYVATKVRDIAKGVGMSTGLLFHYFESKEKLYEELVQFGAGGTHLVMQHIEGGPLEFFQQAADQILTHVIADPFAAKMFVLMMQAMHNDAAPESVKKELAGVNAVVLSAEKIRQGQQEGTIRQGDPLALSMVFWGAINGIAEQIALDPTMPTPQAEWLIDILRKRDA